MQLRHRRSGVRVAVFATAAGVLLVGAAPAAQPGHVQKPAAKQPVPKAPPAPAGHDKHGTSTGAPKATANQAPASAASAHGDAHADSSPAHDPQPETINADAAMRVLTEGNGRWVRGECRNPNTGADRREHTATNGQRPFATILTCADSRLPVERVFDRGVGELFVVRVAGNVVTPEEAGTIEYGSQHLHVPLVVVMGHTRCGAVQAAAEGARPGGNVESLLARIAPAVERARRINGEGDGADLASAAVRENVWQSIFDLIRGSSTTRELIASGELRVVGAVCDVATGRVEWLGEHPWQSALVDAFNSRDAKDRAGDSAEGVHENAHAEAGGPGHGDHR